MTEQNIHFSSHRADLVGTCWMPDSRSAVPLVMMAHPASLPERSDGYYLPYRRHLPQMGIGFCVFDRRGSGESGGNFETADFNMLADDVVAAVEAVKKSCSAVSAIHLLGISQGGWIAPLAAAKSRQIASLIPGSACGVTPAEQMTYSALRALKVAGYGDEIIDLARDLRWKVDDYFRGKSGKVDLQNELNRHKQQPWFDLCYLPGDGELPDDPANSKWRLEMDYDPLPVWTDVHIPSLFLYAAEDAWVPVEESMMLYESAAKDVPGVSMERLADCDHLFLDTSPAACGQVSAEFWKALSAWVTGHSANI